MESCARRRPRAVATFSVALVSAALVAMMATSPALAACATSPENAKTVVEREVTIATPDGTIDAHYAAPSSGKFIS